MKKVALLLSLAILALGCSKEDSKDKTSSSQVKLNKNPENEDEVTSQVINFLDEVEHNNVNDRNKEEALFILEAALNYNYRRPMDEYSVFKEGETTFLELDINNENVVDGTSLANEHERIKSIVTSSLDENEVVELIDISDATDSNGVEELRAVIVIGQPQPGPYYLNVGDWKALAGLGNCSGTVTSGDAASVTASVYNYNYRNNFYLSSVQQDKDVYYSGIEVTGPGKNWSSRYPYVNPDLNIGYDPQNSSTLENFRLAGSDLDNFHPYVVTSDCIVESEINTYASRVNSNIYGISPAPSSSKEPFNVQIETLWLMSQPAPGHHYFHAVFFGHPHTI